MGKIGFLGTPAYGHINPTLPVVRELIARGHQITYFNNEEFQHQITQTGAAFHAYPPTSLTSNEISTVLQDGNLAKFGLLIVRVTRQLLPSVIEQLQHDTPDLVIIDSAALWGRMAATLLGLRAVSSISHFVFDTRHFGSESEHSLRYLGQALLTVPAYTWARRRLTRQYGKAAFPANKPLFPMRGGLNILFTTRELQPETPLIDDTFRFVGPSINPATQAMDFPFDALGEKSIIYISLGTVHHNIDFFRACLAAFAHYPASIILSVGRDTDLTSLGEIPPNFLVRPYVPQLAVVERADVFITHGGLNSIHEGLYHGVPLILIPHQLEQLLNARAVEKRGAGLVIDKQLSGTLQPADLQQALDAIRADPNYRQATVTVQQTLRATGGYRQAADEIERYLANV
jgi:MGT family glycosyltransferase